VGKLMPTKEMPYLYLPISVNAANQNVRTHRANDNFAESLSEGRILWG
jgi:hypothetical protein